MIDVHWRIVTAATVVALALVACGAPPTAGEDDGAAPSPGDDGGTETSAGGGEDPFAAVFAAVDGLEGQERTDRLVELAREEGALNVYTSNTDLADLAEQFAEQYDLEEPSVYRAQAHVVLQRLLEEREAGFAGADFIDTNAEELVTMNQEGLLREYEGPAREGLVDVALQEGWTGSRINTYVVAWNTDLFPDPPTSYEDLADPRFSGKLMVEERAFEWYMALSDYWAAQGRSQEEIDELFADIISNATRVRGNTTQTQFLVAGEYGASSNVYNHLIDEETAAGAPVTWKPAVEPVVLRPNGVALPKTSQNPATAILFYEWLLTDAQELLLEEFRIPARIEAQGGILEGIDVAPVDVEKLGAEGDDWETRYEELLDNAQGSAE